MEEILRAIKTKTHYMTTNLSPADLVDNYSEPIWRFCRSLTYSKEDAEDLFQETFLKAFEQLPKINASNNPKNFLFSTALYLWKSRKRRYARRNRLAPVQSLDDETVANIGSNDIEDNIENNILAQEDTRIVRELVDALPEKFKIPIILHYTIEMSLPDIAAALKMPVGTVKSRLYKARKIIEKGLIEIGYE